MALIKSGRADHDVVRNGVRFILDSFREEGTWPIDTNLATWNTTLSINALSQFSQGLDEAASAPAADDSWNATLDWLLDCQYKTVHPFTGSPPGGWGWSDLSGSVPDADDTPGALLALANLNKHVEFDDERKRKILTAAGDGVRWLLKLQNRDRGSIPVRSQRSRYHGSRSAGVNCVETVRWRADSRVSYRSSDQKRVRISKRSAGR